MVQNVLGWHLMWLLVDLIVVALFPFRPKQAGNQRKESERPWYQVKARAAALGVAFVAARGWEGWRCWLWASCRAGGSLSKLCCRNTSLEKWHHPACAPFSGCEFPKVWGSFRPRQRSAGSQGLALATCLCLGRWQGFLQGILLAPAPVQAGGMLVKVWNSASPRARSKNTSLQQSLGSAVLPQQGSVPLSVCCSCTDVSYSAWVRCA